MWSDKRFGGRRIADFDDYLFDDLRVDPGALAGLDISRLEAIAVAYRSMKIDNLVRFLKRSGGTPHA